VFLISPFPESPKPCHSPPLDIVGEEAMAALVVWLIVGALAGWIAVSSLRAPALVWSAISSSEFWIDRRWLLVSSAGRPSWVGTRRVCHSRRDRGNHSPLCLVVDPESLKSFDPLDHDRFKRNRAKMFHVKHFGKVRPENLTRPHTFGGVRGVRLRGKQSLCRAGPPILLLIFAPAPSFRICVRKRA
jgi:hypothetical protein